MMQELKGQEKQQLMLLSRGKNMINVVYSQKDYSLKINGHSGYASNGNDIVCAGASTLFYTLCQTLLSLDFEKYFQTPPELNIKSGDSYVKCVPEYDYRSVIDNVFFTIINGFELLESEYPNFINITFTKNM